MISRSVLVALAFIVSTVACGGATQPASSSADPDGDSSDSGDALDASRDATLDSGNAAIDSGDADSAPPDAGTDAPAGADDGGCPDFSSCTVGDGGPGSCCAGGCVSTLSDLANCGSCGNRCPTDTSCHGGSCVYSACSPGDPSGPCIDPDGGPGVCCGGVCEPYATIQNDDLNCGTCGAPCPSSLACSGGGCIPSNCGASTVCPAGYAVGDFCKCYPVACTGVATGLGCLIGGNPFPTGTCCSGACLDLSYDPANCGACGHACGAGQYCYGGACLDDTSCAGQKQGSICGLGSGRVGECCAGACVDPFTDPSNCEGCGRVCPVGTTCSGGSVGGSGSSCVMGDAGVITCAPLPGYPTPAACPAGTTCFDDYVCAPASCTAAGVEACVAAFIAPTKSIIGVTDVGVCCGAGSNGCPDLRNDPANCGACGVVCPSGACNRGVCVPPPTSAGCSALGGCPSGTVCAGGVCVQPGVACPGAEYCLVDGGASLGVCCAFSLQKPFCADLLSDPANCGVCGHACAAGQTCFAGSCH